MPVPASLVERSQVWLSGKESRLRSVGEPCFDRNGPARPWYHGLTENRLMLLDEATSFSKESWMIKLGEHFIYSRLHYGYKYEFNLISLILYKPGPVYYTALIPKHTLHFNIRICTFFAIQYFMLYPSQ
uniref:SFRICE_027308 n=1 Tax=Spodoptera frugiperda TaxID=7108 RepID=A0A2H1VKE6_SPOFR